MTIRRTRLREALLFAAAVVMAAAVPALAGAGHDHSAHEHSHQAPTGIAPPGAALGPEALKDANASQARDYGRGERILLVIGGVHASEADAQAAAARTTFGDLQGYYVVPVAQFVGLREQLSEPGDWVLATGFRTDRGAQEFLELASAMGHPAFVTDRVTNVGPRFFGLGQETRPDGTGPQVGAIPGVTT